MKKILIADDDGTTRHVLQKVLEGAGHSVAVASDGVEALEAIRAKRYDLLLLDIWMPRMNGLELLAELRKRRRRPRIVIMTSDDAPETLLQAVREHVALYLHKPVAAPDLLEMVGKALDGPEVLPIEVISARPEWVEMVVPCTREAAERIQAVVSKLDMALAPALRESIAYAFRELLLNAIEWGGRLDPGRKVRIACLRTDRVLIYRIADPGAGFDITNLPHAAVGQPTDEPIAHMAVREEKGLRPGGFGLATVKATVDELLYNEKRNEVVFVKYLS